MASNFELGITVDPKQNINTGFPREANSWYNYESAEKLLGNLEDLEDMITDFLTVQVPRLSILASYASGHNEGISKKPPRLEENKADHRARHNFAGFISIFNTGYLFGVPVKVSTSEEKEQKAIDSFNKLNDIDELNSDLGYDCSRFGRAYELHYRNENDENRVALSSAFDTFVIYDPTVEHNPIAAVRLLRTYNKTETRVSVDLYTADKIYHFKECGINQIKLTYDIDEDVEEHFYGEVPIIEWYNNRFRQGDYETEITLIDLYDSGQSDTANYMSDLNDAMLVIKGHLQEADLTLEEAKSMKNANIMLLEYGTDSDGRGLPIDAHYIYKQYDVAGTEAYKKRLQADIHKFSHTPDFSDENFSGQQTGVAMKYKLLGTDQIRSMKEQTFTKAMNRRYQLLNNINVATFGTPINVKDIAIKFTENLPIDFWQDVQNYFRSGGKLSQQTLLGLLPWVGSYTEEMKRLEAEEGADLPFYDREIKKSQDSEVEDE